MMQLLVSVRTPQGPNKLKLVPPLGYRLKRPATYRETAAQATVAAVNAMITPPPASASCFSPSNTQSEEKELQYGVLSYRWR